MTAPVVETGAAAGAAAASSAGAASAAARTAQVAISAAAMRDAVKLWPLLDPRRLTQTWPGWLQAMILLTKTYHAQSSLAAGRSYRLARAEATRSPAPSSLIKLAAPPSDEWMTRAYGFAGPGTLSKDTAQPNTALSTVLGTTSRIVMDGGRTTVFDTVEDDPVAVGWYLQTDGRPCYWCAMIASRGVVYKEHSLDASNARFEGDGTAKLHNHCHCCLAPAFSVDHELPDISQEAQDVYYDATRGLKGPRNQENVAPLFRAAWAEHLAKKDAA